MERKHSWVEEIFESALYNSRFLVILPVLGSLAASIILFVKGCVEVVQGAQSFGDWEHPFAPSTVDDHALILAFVTAIDDYLFATVLLIFSLGMYELFISKIDPSWRGPQTRPDWLKIDDLDDLKSHIGEVIMMILVINFLYASFKVPFAGPLDVLLLGGGIVFIAITIYVAHHIIHKRKGGIPRFGSGHEPAPVGPPVSESQKIAVAG